MTHEVPVDGELDLHTFAPGDVRSVVEEYVRAAVEGGLTEIRLIHGRGTGVQRSIVRATLDRQSAVSDFWDAPESHLGATIAVLRPRSRRPSSLTIITLAAMLVLAAVGAAQPTPPPELVFEVPPSLEHVAAQIQGGDTGRLAALQRLTGITYAGPPIRVRVAHEESVLARETPSWIAGFAVAGDSLVVLFPNRIGSYPNGSLENVLYHEIAHVLTGRAAGTQPVPRWFNEGLASAAERSGGLERRSRLAWELLAGEAMTPAQLEGLFSQDRRDAVRGYVVSDALVRHILQRHGPSAAARILRRMGQGESFALAVFSTTGVTIDEVFGDFWSRHVVWKRWVAFLGHPFTIWVFVTLLALVAIWRHRRRRFEQRLRWELEERAEAETWEEHRQQFRIH